MSGSPLKRVGAIDAVRGLAVVLMCLHHVVDAWTRDADRAGDLWKALRHLGGVPAPAFLFLAGLSGALVLARERDRATPPRARAAAALRRGLYVLGIAFSLRLFALVADGNPWSLVFRVDILNCMGVALALVGGACALAPTRASSVALATTLALAFLLPTPWVFGTDVTWPTPLLGTYVAGTGPNALFPLFPWVFFLAAGWVAGEFWPRLGARPVTLALAGSALFLGGWAISTAPVSPFPPHDFWRASPTYVAMRLGVQLVLLGGAVRLAPLVGGGRAWGTLELLGRHSLLVYLVHLQLAYGRLGWPLMHRVPLAASLAGTALVVAGCTWLCHRADRRALLARSPAPAA